RDELLRFGVPAAEGAVVAELCEVVAAAARSARVVAPVVLRKAAHPREVEILLRLDAVRNVSRRRPHGEIPKRTDAESTIDRRVLEAKASAVRFFGIGARSVIAQAGVMVVNAIDLREVPRLPELRSGDLEIELARFARGNYRTAANSQRDRKRASGPAVFRTESEAAFRGQPPRFRIEPSRHLGEL